MSEDIATTESAIAPPAAGFFAQHRLAMIGVGVFILIVCFLLLGIAIGMAKKNFEKKFYLTQIEKLKEALRDSLDKRTEQGKEMAELRVQLRAKKDHVLDLEDKVANLERASQKAMLNEAQPKSVESGRAAGVAADPGAAYLRLKAGDCLVDGSTNNTAANWRECLKKSKKTTTRPAATH